MTVLTYCCCPAEFAVLAPHPRRHLLQPIAEVAQAGNDLLARRATQAFHSYSQSARANEKAVLILLAHEKAMLILLANWNAVLILLVNENAALIIYRIGHKT